MEIAGKQQGRKKTTGFRFRGGGKLKKLTAAEARRWTTKRDKLLDYCVSMGAGYYKGNRSKIHIGRLSPGCLRCAAGTFSCLFLTERCNRGCFFCPQNRSSGGRQEYKAKELMNGLKFSSPESYIRYLKEFGYKGVGFSGGEPFLEFNRLWRYVRKIRGSFGDRVYIWAYTNGDLVSDEKLKALASAGLNELRFNLSARDYDLAPVRRAVRHIQTVTVEIPAIPEDFRTVVSLLPKMLALGVKHLNLHQLQYTRYNRRAFLDRGYTMVHAKEDDSPSVLESEITALKIIKSALDSGIALPVHYCGGLYKDRFVARAGSSRLAEYLAKNRGFSPATGSLTAAGLMRRLYWRGGAEEMDAVMKRLNSEMPRSCSLSEGRLFLHPALLDHKDMRDKTVTAAYSCFSLKRAHPGRKPAPAESEVLAEVSLPNFAAKLLFKGIFVEARPMKDAAGGMLKTYRPRQTGSRGFKKAYEAFYRKFEDCEFMPEGLPDYL